MKSSTKKNITIGMLAGVAYLLVLLVHIPVVLFLKYEPKDVVITIGGFLYDPVTSFLISVVVCLVEMTTISGTGPIGALMNLLSTCSFACTAAFIYKRRRTLGGALWGLIAGSVTMVGVMLLWNWLITPLYLGVSRAEVRAMLIPYFLPFNALKAGLNTALTMAVYKPTVTALRRAGLLEERERTNSRSKVGVYLVAGILLVTCVIAWLVLRGIL